jgi:hypothetical protein
MRSLPDADGFRNRERMDLPVARQPDIEELKQDLHPEQVLETLEEQESH